MAMVVETLNQHDHGGLCSVRTVLEHLRVGVLPKSMAASTTPAISLLQAFLRSR